ncbi:unnamed protein product [Darwinula stevensoni]|uniref:Ras-related protein Rab-10 n=1 Tax=Darwinula stevensoni TaxID=69355 RepID=A0A7R9A4K1_9CRUS|nr:unnamed protein product [Darwinula stevensoni]CAG0892706.1 unnamed protein product [Darwinula stevensoni]
MGIMLVYDISNPKSFDTIRNWLRNIEKHENIDIEIIILGNNCHKEALRMVPREEGEAFARAHGVRFYETSIEENLNIDEALLDLAEAILNKTLSRERSEPQDRVRQTKENTTLCCICF